MTVLSIGMALVGALCALDLLLTFGVIRRLRQHTQLLAIQRSVLPDDALAPVGTDVSGSGLDLERETLVGFVAPGCGPCEEQLPAFVAAARGRDRVVAVVSGPADRAEAVVAQLREVAEVIVEESADGVLQKVFGARAFPSYCLVKHNVVAATAGRVADLVGGAVPA